MLIELQAKTKKGKQLISQFGRLWIVEKKQASVPALDNKDGLLITPVASRWIAEQDDVNFTYKIIGIRELGYDNQT